MNNSKNIFILLVTSFLLWDCANRLPPGGGPIDTTRPRIISTSPEDGTKNFKGNRISVKFNRYVDERSFEESVFISPYIGEIEFEWSGKEVEINFLDKLRDNTTYFINIGTDVIDKQNSLNMIDSYSFAFSTGNEIDAGYIKGKVFPRVDGAKVNGIMVFAYILSSEDTINPALRKPDFITQTGKDGSFLFAHIPYGIYRLIAVRDEYRNLLYDIEVDEYGVQSKIINITPTDTICRGVNLKLAKEDTTGPALVKVDPVDQHHIIAEFSESIDPVSIKPSALSIKDTVDNIELYIYSAYLLTSSPKSVVVVTALQDSTKIYRFIANNIRDTAGNVIREKFNSSVFQGSGKAYILEPELSTVSITDSCKDVEPQEEIKIVFSDAIKEKKDFAFVFNDKGEEVPLRKKWLNDAVFLIKPEYELKGSTWHKLRLDLYKLISWNDLKFKDSVKFYSFETIDAESYSSISGMVCFDSTTLENCYVLAKKIGSNVRTYKVKADNRGNFVFPNLVEGKYVLQAFIDRNGNGEYDAGRPYPFEYSETLSDVSDTLNVRARWPLEGVILNWFKD